MKGAAMPFARVAVEIVVARARKLKPVGDYALTRRPFARILVSSADLKPMLCDATSQLAGA